MEKENLLQKLKEKWTNFRHAVGHSKIVKSLATCALASGIALSAAGCHIYIVPDPPVDQTENNTDLNNGNTGNEQGGNNQGNQNEQGGNTNQPTTPTTPAEPDYSQYSQLLQDVLTSDYYNDLIAKHKAGQIHTTGDADLGTNLIENIPYNFLESQGEDITAIQNSDYYVYCDNYVNNENKNELFTRIQIGIGEDKKTQYYKFYLIKHQITDKELEDFTMLREGRYYQSNFFIQELDNQREAELVSEFCINAKAYDFLKAALNNNKEILAQLNNKQVENCIITGFEEEENYVQYVNVEMISDSKSSSAVTNRVALTARLKLDEASGFYIKNGVYNTSGISIFGQEVSSPTPITYFNSYSTKMKNLIKQ